MATKGRTINLVLVPIIMVSSQDKEPNAINSWTKSVWEGQDVKTLT